MSNPKLAYNNLFETEIVTASSEATGFEKENAYDGLTYDGWKPDTSGTHYLTIYNVHSRPVDYWAIFAHDLHINSAIVKLQYSSDNFVSDVNDVGVEIVPVDSRVIFREFSSIDADYWRIKVVSEYTPSIIGVAMIGSALELESTLPVDQSNFISYARDNMYINNSSNVGTLLGKSLIRKGLQGKINFRFMSPAWFRSNWEDFMDHAEQKPFVFVADPTTYPEESIYTYLDGKQTDPRPTNAKYMNFSINVRGFLYGDSGLFDGWDITKYSYSGSPEKKFSVSVETIVPTGIFFKTDGTSMYVLDNGGTIYQYTLSTAWEVNTSSYASKSFPTGETLSAGLFFKPDGTIMYTSGATNDNIDQYNLSTPWDVSTASFDSPIKRLDVSSQDSTPRCIHFKQDGSMVYLLGSTGNDVYQYTLSTEWDISTASYDSKSLNIVNETVGGFGLSIRPNGISIYVSGSNNSRIFQYNMTTLWDISTASYSSKSFNVNLQDTIPRGIFIKPDGLILYVVGDDNNTIYQYDIV